MVRVKALETDDKGRIKLSMKALIERPERTDRADRENSGRNNGAGATEDRPEA